MHVVGTAGHVDHGKSSLVRALTGTDPDRWVEEKIRGMTLDLGFARLRYADGLDAAIVDVPGHERFVHNMLAGAAGIELLLLVVAANEGPRPQTLEHLAILRHLNVRRTVVALTKSDLIEDADLPDVRADLALTLADSVAANAPIVPVSTITGFGLEELRVALRAALTSLAPAAVAAPAYLPIDRVFAIGGHGTIVTGTLMQGRINIGDRLAATGLGRPVRVRALQVFGEIREAVDAGARVAVNLASVERAELRRGAALASAQFGESTSADVRFSAEASAYALLRRRTPVRAYIGSAEIMGTLVFARLPNDGERDVDARLYLREPATIVPGGVFVVRRPSPKTLLGGGTFARVVDTRADEEGDERDAPDSPDALALLAALERVGIAGADPAALGALGNVRADRAAEILKELADADRICVLDRPRAYAPRGPIDALVVAALASLSQHQTAEPWRTGMTSAALARALAQSEPALVRVLATAVTDARIVQRAGYYSTPEFAPSFTPAQRAVFDRIFARNPAEPLLPVPLADVVAHVRASGAEGLPAAFDTLLASGVVHKVHDAVYRDDQIAELRAALVRALRERKTITPAAYRDVVGLSRKYVVPLLEWFDATGVTLRSGDARVLRIARRGGESGA